MTQTQQNLVNRIRTAGSVTVRLYNDGKGRTQWTAAQRLREAGIVGLRGVRVPNGADFQARSVYLRSNTRSARA